MKKIYLIILLINFIAFLLSIFKIFIPYLFFVYIFCLIFTTISILIGIIKYYKYLFTGISFFLALHAIEYYFYFTDTFFNRFSIFLSITGILYLFIISIIYHLVPIIRFPVPTGPFKIGFKKLHLKDNNRKEIYSENKEDKRELLIKIWYPAKTLSNQKTSPYMEDVIKFAIADATNRISLPLNVFAKFNFQSTNSVENSIIIDDQFPLIIFSHGLGGVCDLNTAHIEELVSHGYIVIGINHPYSSYFTCFPDGKKIPILEKFRLSISKILKERLFDHVQLIENELEIWIQDTIFILDELEKLNKEDSFFKKKFDLTRIGIFGHSLGGALAAEICKIDNRCKVGVSLDGSILEKTADEGFDKPFMFIVGVLLGNSLYPSQKKLDSLNMTKQIWDEIVGEYKSRIHKLCKKIGKNACYMVINGAGHFAFTDIALVCPLIKFCLTFDIGASDHIDIVKVTNHYLLAFFDKHLKSKK